MVLLPLNGPGGQTGRSAPGQYVYCTCMAHPTQETLVAKPGMKTPADFSRESFTELVVNVHSSCGVELEEVACFLEPRANGQPHLNVLLRSLRQWKSVAEALLNGYSVYASFAENVRTWAEGVLYGCAPSDHKGEESLDQNTTQWHKAGSQLRSSAHLSEELLVSCCKHPIIYNTSYTRV